MGKTPAGPGSEGSMARILKYLVYLIILGLAGIISYAYVGPYFGADFSAPQSEVRKPVVLNAD